MSAAALSVQYRHTNEFNGFFSYVDFFFINDILYGLQSVRKTAVSFYTVPIAVIYIKFIINYTSLCYVHEAV